MKDYTKRENRSSFKLVELLRTNLITVMIRSNLNPKALFRLEIILFTLFRFDCE